MNLKKKPDIYSQTNFIQIFITQRYEMNHHTFTTPKVLVPSGASTLVV